MSILLEEIEPGPSGLYEEKFKTKKGESKTNIRNHMARYFYPGVDGNRAEDFPDDMEHDINHFFSTRPTTSNLTRIFSLRVFLGRSYDEISQATGIPTELVRGYFFTAKKRVINILVALSQLQRAVSWSQKSALTQHQKMWVLYRIFKLSHTEIQKILPDVPAYKTFYAIMSKGQASYLKGYIEEDPQESASGGQAG